MTRRAACVSILLTAALASAQDKPDFSGRWTLVSAVRQDASVALSLVVRPPVTRTNRLGAPLPPLEQIVERTFVGGVTTDRIAIVGLESGVIGGGGVQSRSSSRWDGSRLVMTTTTGIGTDMWAEHTETWELDPDGMLVITLTDRDANSASRSNTLIYRKST